ncbi:hypothetical protein Q6315_28555, partial [Klebsiella pneumoniae]|uniref:hypothetical protein n=1 Tax=Klebsiella pneumoniae TaxID=573 RepID=UPI0027322B75
SAGVVPEVLTAYTLRAQASVTLRGFLVKIVKQLSSFRKTHWDFGGRGDNVTAPTGIGQRCASSSISVLTANVQFGVLQKGLRG